MPYAREGRAGGRATRGVVHPSGLAAAATVAVLVAAVMAPPASAQEDPFQLEGLVVTASPTPRPAGAVASHVTVLEGAELRAAGITRVLDALRSVPGLSVVQNGSFGATTSVFLRGGESDHALVLVDGVQVNQPGGSFDFASLTLDDVERIEVVRGGASALYGSDAMGGVIHLVTRTGRGGPTGSATARVGSYGRRDASLALSGGGARAGYGVTLTRTRTDGILAFNNRHANTVLSGTVRLAPDDATRARLTVRLGDRRYHLPTDGSGALVDRNAFTYGDETVVGFAMSRRLSAAVELEALVASHETDGGFDDQPDGPADTLGFFGFTSLDHVRRSSVDLRAHVRAGAAVATLGWELEEQRQRSFTESASEFGSDAGRSAWSRDNRAGYAHVTAERGRLSFNAGGRVEDNERFGSSFTWQAGASVRVGGGVRVRAAAARAIKEPTFFEQFATGFARGNPDLDPERSRSWEVGAAGRFGGERVGVEVTWFDQRFEDLIQFTFAPPAPTESNYFNVAAAGARGLEVAADVRAGDLTVRGSWSWVDAEVADPGFGEGPGAEFVPGEPLLRRPAHTLALEAERGLGERVRVTGSVLSVGRRWDRDFSSFPATRVALEGYTRAAVGARVVVTEGGAGRPGLAVQVRADNLFDARYEEVLGFRAPGRALDLAATVSFGGGG